MNVRLTEIGMIFRKQQNLCENSAQRRRRRKKLIELLNWLWLFYHDWHLVVHRVETHQNLPIKEGKKNTNKIIKKKKNRHDYLCLR